MSGKSGHLICVGAQCQCKFGAAPAKLKVLSQDKHFLNDDKLKKKLMATSKELGQPFDAPFFGSCSKMNNAPCAVALTEWTDYYDKVKLKNGAMPLLEGSKGTCSVGAKDCITITWHGQTAVPGEQNAKKTDEKVMSQINPLVDMQSSKEEEALNNEILMAYPVN